MKRIHLHGRLAKEFGDYYDLDVRTPSEAVRGLCVLVKGFQQEIREGHYKLIRGSLEEGDPISLETLDLNLGRTKEIHIIPATHAAGIETVALIIAGVALLAAVAAVLFIPPPPKPNNRERDTKVESFLFDGPVNVTEQGHSVPLVYGQIRTGSVVISAGIETTDIPYNALNNGLFSTPGFEGSPLGDTNIILQKGGKGAGSGGGFSEDPNTLQSQATAQVLEAISEGEIEGLVNGLKSIYLDDTPIQNSDDSYNFQGVAFEERVGLPDQSYIPGFTQQQTARPNGAEITTLVSPVMTITDEDVDKVRVSVLIPSLYLTDTETGSLKKTSVKFAIDLQSNGGGYTEVINHTVNGKTTSDYVKSFDVVLPSGGNPWDIRARRITADHPEITITDNIFLQGITEIIEAKLQYPDTALIGITIDAKQFGSRIPDRSYLVKGLKVQIPSNYNPLTRVYTGMWDGTFSTDWTDNPAWVFYDLIVNDRYGLGRFIDASKVDKFALYAIAQYCDELVNNGQGSTEPRFTFNGVINSRAEAYEVLAAVASNFRGAAYWSASTISAYQDSPADPVKLVTPSNIVDGQFNYEDTVPVRERRSVAVVYYNDPNDGYRLAPEIVENQTLMRTLGWKPGEELTAYGCTSRGQAQRLARWVLDDEANSQEAISYETGDMHADVLPGQIVSVADPDYTEQRQGGRLIASSSNLLQLDASVTLDAGQQYVIKVVLPDGTIGESNVSNGPGETDKIQLETPLTTAPIVGAVWAIETTTVLNRQFRIRKLEEVEDGVYRLTGVLHDPDKYDRVEGDTFIPTEELNFLPTEPLETPTGLQVLEYLQADGNANSPAVIFSWKSSTDPRVTVYQPQYKTPVDDNWSPLQEGADVSRDITNIEPGTYSFRVRALDGLGNKTAWAQMEPVVLEGQVDSLPEVTDLVYAKDDTALNTVLKWTKPANDTRPFKYRVLYNTTLDLDNATLIGTTEFTEYVIAKSGHYWVQVSFLTQVSPSPTNIEVDIANLPNPKWKRLSGTDFDPNNLIPDASFEQGDNDWVDTYSEWSFVSDPITVYGTVLQLEPTGNNQEVEIERFPVSEGDKLKISIFGLRDSSAVGQAGITFFHLDKFGNQLGFTAFDPEVSTTYNTTSWTRTTGEMEVPAGTSVIRVNIMNRNDRSTGTVWLARPFVARFEQGSTDNSDALDGTIIKPTVLKDQGNGTNRPVAIGIADGRAEDADIFTFSPAWQDIPKISFGAGGLLSDAGFTQVAFQDFVAEDVSSSGFTASLRLKEAVGTTVARTSGAFSDVGGTPEWQADGGSNLPASDNMYTYTYNITLNPFFGQGFITVSVWTNDGGGWVKRGTKTSFTTGTYDVSQSVTVTGLTANDDFGVHVDGVAGQGVAEINSVDPVDWVTFTPAGDVVATSSTVKVPFLVIGNLEDGV